MLGNLKKKEKKEETDSSYLFFLSSFSGDDRVNEQPALTLMHAVFLRYHNFLAKALKRARQGRGGRRSVLWRIMQLDEDDIAFLQARAIVEAVMQNILFSEWLPIILGPRVRRRFDLDVRRGSRTRHEPWRDPRIFNSFATAAFRWVENLSFSTSFCSVQVG